MTLFQHLNLIFTSCAPGFFKSLYIDLVLTIYFTLELPKLLFMLLNEKYYLNPLFKEPSAEDVPLTSDKFWLASHLLVVGILLINLYRIYHKDVILSSVTKFCHYLTILMVFFNCTNLVGLNLMIAVGVNLGISFLLCYLFNNISKSSDDVFKYFFVLSALSFVAGIYSLAEFTLNTLNAVPLIIFLCGFIAIH